MRRFFWAPQTHVQTDEKEYKCNFTLKNIAYLHLWKIFLDEYTKYISLSALFFFMSV